MDEYLQELMTSLYAEFWRTSHVVVVSCPGGIALLSYPGALGQVVTNLVTNALVHAFEEGDKGTIRIEVENLNDDVILGVVDDGRGIPADVLPHIFEPFFTTRRGAGGTGLGLRTVYNLVRETLGGTVDVASELGRGTHFTVAIPRAVPEREVG